MLFRFWPNIYLSLKVKRKKYSCSKRCILFRSNYSLTNSSGAPGFDFCNSFAEYLSATKHILGLSSRLAGPSRKLSEIQSCPNQRYDYGESPCSVSLRAQQGADIKMVITTIDPCNLSNQSGEVQRLSMIIVKSRELTTH